MLTFTYYTVHELSHNLCWNAEWANKLTAMLGNACTGALRDDNNSALVNRLPQRDDFPALPHGASPVPRRAGAHIQSNPLTVSCETGVDGVDTDVPTMAEVRFFNSAWRKVRSRELLSVST